MARQQETLIAQLEVCCSSIYIHVCTCMITRCASVRMSVAGCLEAQRGIPVDLNVTKRWVVLLYHKVEAEQQLQGHDRSNSRVQARMARQRR